MGSVLDRLEEISRGQFDRRQKGNSNEKVSSGVGDRDEIQVENNLGRVLKKFLMQNVQSVERNVN